VPFAEFVALVRHILSPFGYRVSVALAPKTSSDQQGLLYEGVCPEAGRTDGQLGWDEQKAERAVAADD
jgi:spore germination protein YaaH